MNFWFNSTKAKRILGIVERLRLRSPGPVLAYRFSSLVQHHSARAGWKRVTVNVIRNQRRNRITLDETNLALPQIMEYDFSQLVRLRRGFAR